MRTEDLILLPLTIYGVPSGNYDGSSDVDFSGDEKKAASYYRRISGGSTQSVRFQTDEFEGSIVIQASLDEVPTQDSDWFDVYTFPPDSSATTADLSVSITGNFAWIRADVRDFVGGTITLVTLTY